MEDSDFNNNISGITPQVGSTYPYFVEVERLFLKYPQLEQHITKQFEKVNIEVRRTYEMLGKTCITFRKQGRVNNNQIIQ